MTQLQPKPNQIEQSGRWKKRIHKRIRYLGLSLGIIFILLGGVMTYQNTRIIDKEEKKVLSSYQLSADASYRVHLHPNSLFVEEWLEENKLYSNKITDYIEFTYTSQLVTTQPIDVQGEYTITSYLEGYQDRGSTRKLLYQERKQLHTEKIDKKNSSSLNFSTQIKIDPAIHKQAAANAESVLGGDANRDFYLLFEGNFLIGTQKQEFSHRITIPIIARELFFDIIKPEKILLSDEISETSTLSVRPEPKVYLPFVLLFALGFLLLLFILFFTKEPEGEELRIANLANTMRKFESHMICVEALPEIKHRTMINIKEMHNVISLAEEIRKPILYCTEESGLPKDGCFYIYDTDFVYFFKQ